MATLISENATCNSQILLTFWNTTEINFYVFWITREKRLISRNFYKSIFGDLLSSIVYTLRHTDEKQTPRFHIHFYISDFQLWLTVYFALLYLPRYLPFIRKFPPNTLAPSSALFF